MLPRRLGPAKREPQGYERVSVRFAKFSLARANPPPVSASGAAAPPADAQRRAKSDSFRCDLERVPTRSRAGREGQRGVGGRSRGGRRPLFELCPACQTAKIICVKTCADGAATPRSQPWPAKDVPTAE